MQCTVQADLYEMLVWIWMDTSSQPLQVFYWFGIQSASLVETTHIYTFYTSSCFVL